EGKGDGGAVDGVCAVYELRVDIDVVLVVEPAVVFTDTHDFVAGIGHELGGVGAHVPEALNDDARVVADHVEFLQRFIADHHDAAARRFAAPARSADVNRFPRYYRGHGLPHVHGIGVHHPGHGLLVGVHVRGGNVLLRTKKFDQLGGVAARELFKFGER